MSNVMFHFLQPVTSILFWGGLIFRLYNYNPETAVLNIHDRCLLNWNTFEIKFTSPPLYYRSKRQILGPLFCCGPLKLKYFHDFQWNYPHFKDCNSFPLWALVCILSVAYMLPGPSKCTFKLYARQHPSINTMKKN